MASTIERFTTTERVHHWTVVLSFFILVFTGLGLYSHTFFSYFDFFGGPQKGILFHKWSAIVFLISSVLLFFSHRPEITHFDADDRRWLSVMGGYLSRGKTHIPQGKFNAGQKLFGVFSFVATLVMAATGFIIWDATAFARGLTRLSLMLHGLFFILFMMGVVVHIYLASVGNPGTLEGMLWGRVSRLWAKKHAAKWYKEVSGE